MSTKNAKGKDDDDTTIIQPDLDVPVDTDKIYNSNVNPDVTNPIKNNPTAKQGPIKKIKDNVNFTENIKKTVNSGSKFFSMPGLKEKVITDNDLIVQGLEKFAEEKSNDANIDKDLNGLLTDDKKSLNSLNIFYSKVKEIEGITALVNIINDNILELRKIIDNLYTLAASEEKNKKEELLKLRSEAKQIINNIIMVTDKVSRKATTDMNTLKTAVDKANTNTKIDEEADDYNLYEKNESRPELFKKRKSEGKKLEVVTKKEKKEGGNPYKTAKKQFGNLMSYIPGMPQRKTQKKHRKDHNRKNRRH